MEGQLVDDTFPHNGRGSMIIAGGLGAPAVMVMVSFVKRIVDVKAVYESPGQVVKKEEQALGLPVPWYVMEVWFGLRP